MEKEYEATVTDLYFEMKLFLSDVWYLYIADEKGDRFNPVPGVITYLMEAFTKTGLLLAKMKWFICDVIPDSHPIGAMTE